MNRKIDRDKFCDLAIDFMAGERVIIEDEIGYLYCLGCGQGTWGHPDGIDHKDDCLREAAVALKQVRDVGYQTPLRTQLLEEGVDIEIGKCYYVRTNRPKNPGESFWCRRVMANRFEVDERETIRVYDDEGQESRVNRGAFVAECDCNDPPLVRLEDIT